MAKVRRGNPLKKEGFERGTCPITGLTGVKLLYEHTNKDGETVKISKSAHAQLRNQEKIKARKEKSTQAESTQNTQETQTEPTQNTQAEPTQEAQTK